MHRFAVRDQLDVAIVRGGLTCPSLSALSIPVALGSELILARIEGEMETECANA
jgi:hypothetical protein